MKTDVCIIGSGAGAGPVASELAKAGYKVVVLEKGPWIKTKDFAKDEMVAARREKYIPNLKDEQHVIVSQNKEGEWVSKTTYNTGNDFWNGNVVGGSSNFMTGFFHRMKPNDFKLKSTYGEYEGANVEDWPISYEELEPYYTKAETEVGISGEVKQHSALEPRSTENFPYPKLEENIISSWIDKAAEKTGIEVFPAPRAIISEPKEDRKSCYYSGFCNTYGCYSDAKGSSRAALLKKGAKTGNLTIIPKAKVYHLTTNGEGKVVQAKYYNENNEKLAIEAKIFVVACQAVETSRLLLMSKNEEFPNGLANNNNQVGKNLMFSGGGVGSGTFYYSDLEDEEAKLLSQKGYFVNRASQAFYEINDEKLGKIKGGTVDFLFEHPDMVAKANKAKWSGDKLLFGAALKRKVKQRLTGRRKLLFEIFCDWMPNDNCKVELDEKVTDKWGDPVAKIWTGHHQQDLIAGEYIGARISKILEEMGAYHVGYNISGYPSSNLMIGSCRFGNDPRTSVLDKNCKAHEVENLYVTDSSFMPTGGSVTPTWTIYANSFRVADKIKEKLKSIS